MSENPKIFFQCSLPRSGSTLLQNLMGQNPDIYVTPTSGLIELLYGARKNYTEVSEFKAEIDKESSKKAFLQFCNAGIHAYAKAKTEKPYFLDKGRAWAYYLDWVEMILPYKPKIICMVRDLRDVFSSLEKLFRRNPEQDYGFVTWQDLRNVTLAKRIDTFSTSIPLGIAIERLQHVFEIGNAHKILFIKYEDFCLRPDMEMARIYNYLEIPHFAHNFDNIIQITQEDDSIYYMTDHKIRNRLDMKMSDSKQILGDAICDWIYQRYQWFYHEFKYNK